MAMAHNHSRNRANWLVSNELTRSTACFESLRRVRGRVLDRVIPEPLVRRTLGLESVLFLARFGDDEVSRRASPEGCVVDVLSLANVLL